MISTGRVLGVKPRSALASKPDLDPQLFNRLDRNQTEVCSGSKSRFWAIASSRARPWPRHAFRSLHRRKACRGQGLALELAMAQNRLLGPEHFRLIAIQSVGTTVDRDLGFDAKDYPVD